MTATTINEISGAHYGGELTLCHGLNTSPKGHYHPLLGSGEIARLVLATPLPILGIWAGLEAWR